MKKGAKKTVLITLLVFAAAALAVTGTVIKNGRMEQAATKAEPNQAQVASAEKKAVNVAVQILEPKNVEETFTLPGTLEAWEDLTLSLEQPGPN